MRLLIIGVPRAGKTTLSKTRSSCPVHLDDWLGKYKWSELSDKVAEALCKDGDWVIEGCSGVRGLRKWLRDNPGMPPFEIQFLSDPVVAQSPKQRAFGLACSSIWKECQQEIRNRKNV